jgi:pre-mRNA-splicing factor SYF1
LEAAKVLLGLARRAAKGTYKSPEGKSPLDLLSQVLEVAEKWPDDVGLDFEDIPPPAEKPAGEEKGEGSPAAEAEEPASVNGKSLMRISGAPVPAGQAPAEQAAYDPHVDPVNANKLDVERVVREDGLAIYKDQAGRLWSGLATYWIKKGEFDKVRQVLDTGAGFG